MASPFVQSRPVTSLQIDRNMVFQLLDCQVFIPLGVIQIYSGITRGRVLNGELYTHRLQKLVFLYLSTGCFGKLAWWLLAFLCCGKHNNWNTSVYYIHSDHQDSDEDSDES